LLATIRDSEYLDEEVLGRYESVGGIRIEDAVVITGDGCDNLTKVGKSIEWLEGVCSGQL
jgi:Xaa-Pro dipeptidase